jgi:hypothetical protein
LEVRPPDEVPFIAIAEDSYFIWDFVAGQQINVGYDLQTKDIALEKPRKLKNKTF